MIPTAYSLTKLLLLAAQRAASTFEGSLLLVVILLTSATTIFAVDNKRPDPCKTEICVRIKPVDGEVIEIPLSAVKISKTINGMLEDLGDTDALKQEIPINANHRTLKAIANILMAMQKMKEKKKEFKFRPMKWLIKNSVRPHLASKDFIVHLLLTANYLDIQPILIPAVALWFETLIKEKPTNDIEWAEAVKTFDAERKKIKKAGLPRDILLLFDDYLNWLKNPTSLIVVEKSSIAVGSGASAITGAQNKLYIANEDSNTISVIDTESDRFVDQVIEVGRRPRALAVMDNKLYVANNSSNTVSVIDTTNNQVIGQPIAVGLHPRVLIAVGNKIYVANMGVGTISVIDAASDKVIGQQIVVMGSVPGALAAIGNKLYVANLSEGTISVMDTTSDKVIRQSIAVGSDADALAVMGDKLFVANHRSNTIAVVDTRSDRVMGQPIGVERWPSALAVVSNKLFVANLKSNSVSVIDTSSDQVIGEPIPIGKRPQALVGMSDKLYVLDKDGRIWVLALSKFLNMFNYFANQ